MVSGPQQGINACHPRPVGQAARLPAAPRGADRTSAGCALPGQGRKSAGPSGRRGRLYPFPCAGLF